MNILIGYDGSKVAQDCLALAGQYAKAFGGAVFIVRSLAQGPALDKDDIESAEDRLESLQRSFQKDGIECQAQVIVSYHTPGEDLVAFAKENDIEQIIIGIRRRSKVGKLVFGSTAQYVILEAPCPVLTVK